MIYPYIDESVTDDEIKSRLGFDKLGPCNRRYFPVGGPFSITAETRQGVKGFRVTDMRQGFSASLRTLKKKQATRIAKLIEKDAYAK